MIDAARWLLAEAWLSLGLRIEWMPSYQEREIHQEEWQEDGEGRRFVYDGLGVWRVLNANRSLFDRRQPTAPSLSTESMKHELAHYLAATPTQRQIRNFNIGAMGRADGEEKEAESVEAEQIIDAMLTAASRICELALRGRS